MKMKNMKINELLMVSMITLFLSGTSFAQGGDGAGHVGGGGEDGVFKKIRNEVGTWLEKNQQLGILEKKLELSTFTGSEFLESFQMASKEVGDQIVFNHDEIKFGQNIRVCKNDRDTKIITCNIEEWNHIKGNTQYMIVLHEFLGIAGIETNIAEYSTYSISPKILNFVHSKDTYELGMEKNDPTDTNPFLKKARELFQLPSSVKIANLKKTEWKSCVGMMFATANMSCNPAGCRASQPYWTDFNHYQEFEFTGSNSTGIYKNTTHPNLPYDGGATFGYSTLKDESTFISRIPGFVITTKVIDANTIVAEAAMGSGQEFYEQFKPLVGSSVAGNDYLPFAYFICTQ